MEEAQPIALSKNTKVCQQPVYITLQQNSTITAMELFMKHVICTYIMYVTNEVHIPLETHTQKHEEVCMCIGDLTINIPYLILNKYMCIIMQSVDFQQRNDLHT